MPTTNTPAKRGRPPKLDLSQYNGHTFGYKDIIAEKSSYCRNYYRGLFGEEVYAHSDDDNWTEYSIDGIPFAESFTSEGDVLHVYNEFLRSN